MTASALQCELRAAGGLAAEQQEEIAQVHCELEHAHVLMEQLQQVGHPSPTVSPSEEEGALPQNCSQAVIIAKAFFACRFTLRRALCPPLQDLVGQVEARAATTSSLGGDLQVLGLQLAEARRQNEAQAHELARIQAQRWERGAE